MKLKALKQQFLDYLKTEKGRSLKTIENYGRSIDRFLAFTKVAEVEDLSEEQIRRFEAYLAKQEGAKAGARIEKMKVATKNHHLIALRMFFRFINAKGVETFSPKIIKLERVSRTSPNLISATESKLFLSTIKTSTIEGKRDRAIFATLFSAGLRIAELCNLRVDDVDLGNRELRVRAKEEKFRLIPITSEAARVIKIYLVARKDEGGPLFVRYGKKSHIGSDAGVSPRNVQRLVKHYAKLAGITKKITPHAIRHSFAANKIGSGLDLNSVQSLLGHAHVVTTKVYASKLSDQFNESQ